MGEDHDEAQRVLSELLGVTPRKHPAMGALGESHGPPSFPREVPSFVCQELLNGPGACGS